MNFGFFISNNKPHIIGITETKIDSTVQNGHIEIDDYVIERNDRINMVEVQLCTFISQLTIDLGKIYKIPMWNQSLSK